MKATRRRQREVVRNDIVADPARPAKGYQNRCPREALISAMKSNMLATYGHDLPAEDFAYDADAIIAWLAEGGFEVVEAAGQKIDLQHDSLIGPIRFDAGTYRIQRVARDPDAAPAF